MLVCFTENMGWQVEEPMSSQYRVSAFYYPARASGFFGSSRLAFYEVGLI